MGMKKDSIATAIGFNIMSEFHFRFLLIRLTNSVQKSASSTHDQFNISFVSKCFVIMSISS